MALTVMHVPYSLDVRLPGRRVGSETDDGEGDGESGVGSNVNLLEMGTTKV